MMGALASPQKIGRYTIYGKIASGGMASVHFGRLSGGEGFARTVAIKRLHPHLAEDPEFRATLIDEARMAARINHPNVVPTIDVVSEDGELLVVMEYVRGESLSRLWKFESTRGRQMPLPIVSAVAVGTLSGLHAAHEATSDRGTTLGIVHRDISPQNILVGADGLARVIDFGVAKAAGRLQTTGDGAVKGKIAYMAPEQIATGDVTRRADVYAMGVVLWEMLTGKRLFQGENEAALVAKVLAGVVHPPSRHVPNTPAGLDLLVMTALATDPASRFGTAQEMAETLVRLLPPALPSEVGRWVEESAGDALAERAERLADIESASGVLMIPARLTSAFEHGSEGLPLGTFAHASQSSSRSVRGSVLPRRQSRRVMLAGAIGVGSLVALGILTTVIRGGPASAAPGAAAALGSAPALPPQVPASASASAIPTVSERPGTDTTPPTSTASARPSRPLPGIAATRPRVVTQASVVPTPPTPGTPKPASNCTPPYVIDSAGNHQYKPECL